MVVDERLRQWFAFVAGRSTLSIGRHERSHSAAPWEFQEVSFTTDMKISDVTFCSGGSEIYVAGVRASSAGCEDVIERWDLLIPPGGWAVSYDFTPQPIGAPLAMPFSSQVTTQVVGGGPFVPPSARPRQPRVNKTVVFAGDVGVISAIEADPEGRFLLVKSYETGDIHSLDLMSQSPAITPIFSAAQHPQLLNTQNIYVVEHVTLGRLYAVPEGSKHIGVVPLGARYTYLRDVNNDGLFEGIDIMDAATYQSSEYYDQSLYTSLVNTGVSTP